MVIVIVFMTYLVYHDATTSANNCRVTTRQTQTRPTAAPAPAQTQTQTRPARYLGAPHTVAIRSACVVTMPPAPARHTCGEKTALFSGHLPIAVRTDDDPYKHRGQATTDDWSCSDIY
jgi:hypothetical protein